MASHDTTTVQTRRPHFSLRKELLVFLIPLCLALTGCPGRNAPKVEVEKKSDPDKTNKGAGGSPAKKGSVAEGPWAPPGGKWEIKEKLIFDKAAAEKEFVPGTLRVSPDGKRYAYCHKDGDEFAWVVDGNTNTKFGRLNKENLLQFSPDGKHYVYAGCIPPASGVYRLVVDDKYRYAKTREIRLLAMTPDAKHLAHDDGNFFVNGKFVRIGASRDVIFATTDTGIRWAEVTTGTTITIDGKSITAPGSVSQLQFAANGKTYAYLVDNSYAVVNGNAHNKRFDRVSSKLLVSTDGERVLYAGTEGKQNYLSDNNKWIELESEPWPSLALSPDGKRWACRVGSAVVLDGKKGKEYPTAKWGSGRFVTGFAGAPDRPDGWTRLVFSPDGKQIAYTAGELVKMKNDKGEEFEKYFAFVVRDGVEQKRYAEVSFDPFFSPDGRYLAYHARETPDGDKFFTINGETVGKPNLAYHPSASPSFSPDSKSVGFVMKRQGEWFAVLDGQEQKTFEEIGPGGTRVGYTPDGMYTYIAIRKGAYYWVEAQRK